MNALQLCPWQFSRSCYGSGATSKNRSKISDFAPTRSLWSKISGTRGRPPPIIFAQLVRQWMPYNFAADSFHTKKLCSRLSSSEVHFLIEIGRFAFLRPPLGDLRATYDDRLGIIGKRVVDFLLALIELFRYVLRLRSYERLLVENRRFRFRSNVDPKFQVEGVALPPTILLLRKLG